MSPQLHSGQRLGQYEISAQIGEGGMGLVFKAKDFQLGREVALKVLPEGFSADPERVARFEREAKLLASLNHPNIAQIYGLETAPDGTRALVMELVEGPTLAERLAQGSLPLDESLSLARQIAEALEAAHERGIVHRDLKPQNVKASIEGKVKVLDFGLAKAMDPSVSASTGSPSAAELARSPTLMNSPTLTSAGTQLGVILGTAAYMAPEQARGGAVDARADIWAFGVVLFEMLTGEPLFTAETVADTLARVLTREPDFGRLPAATPPALRRLLRRCLVRKPHDRLHSIADARIVLAEIERGADDEVAAPVRVAGAAPRGRGLLGAGLVVLALLGGVAASRLWRAPAAREPAFHRLTSESGFIHSARFAPDASTIVYGEARGGAAVALFTTRADAVISRPLDLPAADVVGISKGGDMALLLRRHHIGSWLRIGTLAQAPLAGGTPRELLEDVYDADISPDGTRFAVVRLAHGRQQLEYPIGKVLYRTSGWISSPRVSPDGAQVAFADHPVSGDDQGSVATVGADGVVRRRSESLNFMHGVGWSPDGRAVFASYGSADRGGYIDAFAADGSRRNLLRQLGFLRLQDVAPDGRLLVTADYFPIGAEGRVAGGRAGENFLAWTGDTVEGVSSDGTLFAGTRGGFLEGGEYRTYFGRSDGSPPVILGPGASAGLTPDGKWVFVVTYSRDRTKLRAVPTGAGETRTFDLAPVEPLVAGPELLSCTADGRRVAFLGAPPGEVPRGYVYDLDGGAPPRAVAPEASRSLLIAPDGRWLAAVDADGRLALFDTSSGARRELSGAAAGEVPAAWAGDSRALLVWDQTMPMRIHRIDLATGHRELAVEWQPSDPAGVLYGLLAATPDARYFLLRYRRGISTLAVAEHVE